jgi:two-component system phosphate regulon response regulator PhoB/two-component system alkaline phosphatase synthesis response regulator PhoP
MKKILIAEDDKFLASALRVKLTKAAFEVKNAYNGVEALTIANEFFPDLILLDLVMPVKDGFGVLEDIRNNSKLNKIPIIIASNLGQKEDIDKGMALGAKDYVIKSDLSLDDLIKKINTLL